MPAFRKLEDHTCLVICQSEIIAGTLHMVNDNSYDQHCQADVIVTVQGYLLQLCVVPLLFGLLQIDQWSGLHD